MEAWIECIANASFNGFAMTVFIDSYCHFIVSNQLNMHDITSQSKARLYKHGSCYNCAIMKQH